MIARFIAAAILLCVFFGGMIYAYYQFQMAKPETRRRIGAWAISGLFIFFTAIAVLIFFINIERLL